jgi:hypothetical protein
MLKPYINNFLISAELEGGMPEIIGANGELLSFDKSFQPQEHACQYATVIEVPDYFDERRENKTEIKKGDKVFVSYDVIQKENQFFYEDKELYFCDWEVLIGKVEENRIIPTNDHFFVEKIKSEYEGILAMPTATNVPQKVIVVESNEICRAQGIVEGDTLFTVLGTGVPVKNTDLFYCRPVSVYGKEIDGEIIPIKGRGVIKEYDKNNTSLNPDKFYTGKLLRNDFGMEENIDVCFVHSSYTRLMYNEERYVIVQKNNIIYKL